MSAVDVVLQTIAEQRKTCEAELDRLAKAEDALGPSSDGPTPDPEPSPAPDPAPAARSPRRKSGRKAPPPTPAEAKANREAMYRFLLDHGEPVGSTPIRKAVGTTSSRALAGLKRLIEEGRVRKEGPTTNPTYEAIVKPGTATPPPQDSATGPASRSAPILDARGGTLTGRIVSHLGFARKATEGELASALDAAPESIREAIGALIREGEVRYQREGGVTYVVEDPSAA